MVKFDNANAFDTPDGTNKRGSIANSPPRSTTTIPRRVNVPVGTSPCSSTRWPDAAASLREGLEDVITVRRLSVGGRLAASLTNTSCIESMISIACDTTKNVK